MKLFPIEVCYFIATAVFISKISAQCPYRAAHISNEPICPYSRIANPPLPPASVNSLPATLHRIFSAAVQSQPYSPIPAKIYSQDLLKIINSTKAPKQPIPCIVAPANCLKSQNNLYRNIDGTCNNLQNPLYGAARTRVTRMLPPRYGNDVYTPTLALSGNPLPNARLLSLLAYGDVTLPDETRTLAALQWGQLLAHDCGETILQGAPENCCANIQNKLCYPILLNANDPSSSNANKQCLHMARGISDMDTKCPRSGLNYAEKLSKQTGFADLSTIYGNSLEESQKTRTKIGGQLKTSLINNRNWMPIIQNVDGECGAEDKYHCFGIPDRRNQFIPAIATINTLYLREHNRVAQSLAEINPSWNDERLFQVARKIVIAQYQKVIYYDLLPLILGSQYLYANKLIYNVPSHEYVHDYDVNVNAQPFVEFSTAAFRYSHNQIPGWFSLVSSDRVYNTTLRLSDYFARPETVNLLYESDNFNSLLRGLTTQRQKLADANIDKEIKYYFNRKSNEKYGSDLKAIDIQRTRDYGTASYNDLRSACGLPRAYDWSGYSNEISPEKITILARNYESYEDVEANVGGSLEAHAPGAHVGPTFRCIIAKQLLNTRTGDRFFFENGEGESAFTRGQLAEIRKSSVSGLICNNGDNLDIIQRNAFIIPNEHNPLECCQKIPKIDLTKWKET